ncbi:MAG: M50 family metallopeptidase [Bacillota bacterium]
MTILLFILVLVALIVVHEFGHFVVAKLSGMKVEEFGLGYPPRAWGKKFGETDYTLNWLPFGGFVRIYGEDEQDHVPPGPEADRAFGARPRILQALVLLAGIAMNLLFAWVLLSATLAIGTPRALTDEQIPVAKDVALTVARVLPGSPAAEAGIAPGDRIVSVRSPGGAYTGNSPDAFTAFVDSTKAGTPLTLHVAPLSGDEHDVEVTTRTGIIPDAPDRAALGVAVAVTGVVPVSWWKAPAEGAVITWEVTKQTAAGLWHFFHGIVTFTADLSQVAGPVGIAGAVGQASSHGIAALLTITAIISINLALINLIPVPALDGGRLLFVLMEAVIRRPLPAAAARAVNMVGFAALILLMVVVTAHDVFKILG